MSCALMALEQASVRAKIGKEKAVDTDGIGPSKELSSKYRMEKKASESTRTFTEYALSSLWQCLVSAQFIVSRKK